MRSAGSVLKPGSENVAVMETEKNVEVKAVIPKVFEEFICYVSESLGIPEEKLAGMFIGDSLSTLSSFIPDEYRDDWKAVMGFADEENTFSPEVVERVLPGLAVMFILKKHHEALEQKAGEGIITMRLSGRRAEIAKWVEERTGKPIEQVIMEALMREYQELKE